MDSSYIAVVDSGVGGVSVLNECLKVLPRENYIYYADIANSPYGNKNKRQLNGIIKNIIEHLSRNYNIKIFVLACNTITATSIECLRASFPKLIFVGIEPAIKPAIQASGNTLVMLTDSTYRYSRFVESYIGKFDGLYFCPQKTLAKIIDSNLSGSFAIQKALDEILEKYASRNIQNVVLGCTHFVFIKREIKKILGDVRFFDSAKGVAERVKQLVCGMATNGALDGDACAKKENSSACNVLIEAVGDLAFSEKIREYINFR